MSLRSLGALYPLNVFDLHGFFFATLGLVTHLAFIISQIYMPTSKLVANPGTLGPTTVILGEKSEDLVAESGKVMELLDTM